jgi:ABC-2 type transport system permease protein
MATVLAPTVGATDRASRARIFVAPALTRLLRHEWRLLIADRVGWMALLLFGALLLGAAVQGTRRVHAERRAIATVAEDERVRLDALRAQLARLAADSTAPRAPNAPDPRLPGPVGATLAAAWATLPPAPLLALATGQSDLVRSYVKVSTGARQSVVQLEQLDNPRNLLEGGFDLATAILLLLPLVVIALGYGLLAEEREQGTLAMVLAQPVPLSRIILAKVVVRGGALWLITVMVVMIAAITGGVLASDVGGGFALAVWIGAITAWIALWLAGCVIVNARGRSSAANALRLTASWLVLVVVLPALATALAQWRHPAPSRVALIGELREVSNAANARGTELMKQFFGDHPELAPAGTVDMQDFAARRLVVQSEIDRTVTPLLDRFGAQRAAQQRTVQQWQWLSPAIALHTALVESAGTGTSRYGAFERAVIRFHADWLAFFSPRIMAKRRLTAADYAALPTWRWDESAVMATQRSVSSAATALGVVVALALIVAVRSARRAVAGG